MTRRIPALGGVMIAVVVGLALWGLLGLAVWLVLR